MLVNKAFCCNHKSGICTILLLFTIHIGKTYPGNRSEGKGNGKMCDNVHHIEQHQANLVPYTAAGKK